jgi:HSP20 family protein
MFFTNRTFDQTRNTLHALERLLGQFDINSVAERGHASSCTIPLNIINNEQGAVITAEIPGIDPTRVAISALGNALTIQINAASNQAQEAASVNEKNTTQFSRTVHLPFDIDSEHTEAQCVHGLLTVTVKRQQLEKSKTISIKVT